MSRCTRSSRLPSQTALLALLACAAWSGVPAQAGGPEPKESVALAKSWDAAVAEARLLNVPIVVHVHGFFCPPCWGMHSAVMLNKKYMEFAEKNTVEVISLQRLQEGIEKKDKRAETYSVKVGGETVEYLVEFPGLTVEDMLALERSKANSYNKTGGIPYTCVVDPWTEEEIVNFPGSTPGGDIMDAVTKARETLAETHGKGVARKDVRALSEAEADAEERIARGDFAAALATLKKAQAKSKSWPQPMVDRLAAAGDRVMAAAEECVARLETSAAEDPAKARTEASRTLAKLKGTGLEDRLKRLLATP